MSWKRWNRRQRISSRASDADMKAGHWPAFSLHNRRHGLARHISPPGPGVSDQSVARPARRAFCPITDARRLPCGFPSLTQAAPACRRRGLASCAGPWLVLAGPLRPRPPQPGCPPPQCCCFGADHRRAGQRGKGRALRKNRGGSARACGGIPLFFLTGWPPRLRPPGGWTALKLLLW
jgi:hypothetical protein